MNRSRFQLYRVPICPDAHPGRLLSPTSEKIIGITKSSTIPSGINSSTDISRLLTTKARYERSNRFSSSIRIFSKGLALNAFTGFRSSDEFYPRFLKLRALMVGCSAGEAHLAATETLPVDIVAETLSNGIVKQAKLLNAQLVVLKEFPSRYRKVLHRFVQCGFARAPSMPMTMLDIGYDSFGTYMVKALKSSTRRKLRKKLEATAGVSDIRLSVTDDAASFVDEIYPLYLQVFERSRMQFEKLTKDFFRQIGQRMSDKVRFFAWRRGNTLVAFSLCMVQGDSLYAEYVGFDYSVALDLHLYHYVVRDMISWGISKGYKWFRSSGLNYDPKLHMRHQLDPIDLYVRHTSALPNAIFRLALPWIVPARYDATLKLFPDYKELW